MSKYEIDNCETKTQPNSNETVLLNRLNITSVEEMDNVEAVLLIKLYEKVFNNKFSGAGNNFSFNDIAIWHRQWLGNVYEWAGKIRNVDMGKCGFQFTSPLQISRYIDLFESEFLAKFSELPDMNREELVSYIARSHVEFILIHPFREGNGRISRLLIDVMSHQAGLGLLDYSLWDKHKDFYIASIQAGVARDYKHIERLVRDILIS